MGLLYLLPLHITISTIVQASSAGLACTIVSRVLGDVEQSMTGGRQTVAVLLTFRNSNKNSLERLAGAYQSSRKKNTL